MNHEFREEEGGVYLVRELRLKKPLTFEEDGITVTRVIDEWRIYKEEEMEASSLPPARTYTTDTLLRWLCLAVTQNNSPF